MSKKNTINLQQFYPNILTVQHIAQTENSFNIQLRSITTEYECPKCHMKTTMHHHGTYVRKAQDLPIVGKNVQLEITANTLVLILNVK